MSRRRSGAPEEAAGAAAAAPDAAAADVADAAAPAVAAAAPGRARRTAAERAAQAIAADADGANNLDPAVARARLQPAGSRKKGAAGAKKAPAKKATAKKATAKRERSRSPDPTDSPSEEEEEEEEEEVHPASKRQRTEQVRAHSPDPGGAAQRLRCLCCHAEFGPGDVLDPCVCPVCGLLYTVAEGAAANVLRARRLAAASPAAAASSVHSSQLDTASNSKPKLGAYETELRRLLEQAGDVLPRFQAPDTIGHESAINGVRANSYLGLTYAHQSPWLTRLVRSGHFKELSLAVPRTNADVLDQQIKDAQGGKLRILVGTGDLTTTAELAVERRLSSLEEFLTIFVSVIAPTLFDRPRALLDWLELERSVIDVTRRDGWALASRYLTDLLNDRVPTRQPFNVFDHNLMATARAAAQPAGDDYRGPARSPGGSSDDRFKGQIRGACRDWNFSGACNKSPCHFKHECCWAACSSKGDGHKGKDCGSKPAGTPRGNTPQPGRRRGGAPAKGAQAEPGKK